jgi:hypothetical protein
VRVAADEKKGKMERDEGLEIGKRLVIAKSHR